MRKESSVGPPKAAQRRGRDSNPRETGEPLRDFQSRPLDHSGTSPAWRIIFNPPSPVHFALAKGAPYGDDGTASELV